MNINNLTIDNLFDYCSDNELNNNSIFFIDKKIYWNTLIITAIDDNNKIIKFANEWLYFIYNKSNRYNNLFITSYKDVININNIIYINENVIPFISSFSKGTVHGYAGLFCIIYTYITNFEKYKNYKIIVYNDSQLGMLQIIEHLCNINLINKNNIIYIDDNIKYKFKSIFFIKNKLNTFYDTNIEETYCISNFININWKNINTEYYNKVSIIKSNKSINITNTEEINYDNYMLNICNKYNLINIEAGSINENTLISIINNCKILVTTWGSAFLKNMIYISDTCEYIIVLIYGINYIQQYKNKLLPLNIFKNTKIIYKIIDETLNINDDSIEQILLKNY